MPPPRSAPRPGAAPRSAKAVKPADCTGCSLYDRGHGFVPPSGPENAAIAWMGEAPGYDEAAIGMPFVGAAGSMLERILRRNRLNRKEFRVGNILQCVPPNMLLEGMPWQHSAIQQCKVHRDQILTAPGHKVIMAAGGTAIKTLLGLHGHDRIRVEEFHGTVHWSEEYQKHIVCTFHPSYLQRGAHNLIGTVSFDLQTALEIVRGQWQPEPIEKIIDPPYEWMLAFVEMCEAMAAHDPDSLGLATDIETPDKAGGKPENELTPDDVSYQINRINYAVNGGQGVTCHYDQDPRFTALHARLLALKCRHYWWNGYGYDWSRVWAKGHEMLPEWQLDLMVAAHVLQSDVPLGLGFWAPFYSRYGAWKYLSGIHPEEYACIDGPQTWRVATGIIGDLIHAGQWRAFDEDCHELYHHALKPAQDVGILIDRPELETFHTDLATKQLALLEKMQEYVPENLKPLTHETGKAPDPDVLHPEARTHTLRGVPKKDAPDPIKGQLYARAQRVERTILKDVLVCTACGATEIQKRHRCKVPGTDKPDKNAVPAIELQELLVRRWYWQEPFNPDSPKQMLAYIVGHGHKPGKNKKTKEDSADRETLVRLAKSTKDPFYQTNLDYRAVKKVDSTYAIPTMRRVDAEVAAGREPRLHPIPTFRPSTMRLSYVSPNITNVVQDKGGKKSLAAGFRRCVVASPGCRLLEVDYSGIEAVETGWYARDPAYIRLARLGVHAYLASHLLGRPADLRWSDADLLAYFGELKKAEPKIYDSAKRCVHGTNYGLTPYGMANTFPDLYPSDAAAEKVQRIYFEICPALPAWHKALRARAYDVGCLGGAGDVFTTPTNQCYIDYAKDPARYAGVKWWPHPFQYLHWFWSVITYKPITEAQKLWNLKRHRPVQEINGRWFSVGWGEDSKRVIAMYPQGTASGVLKRTILELHREDSINYIGDVYHGQTCFRAPIHDSGLFDIPIPKWDETVEKILRAFMRPIVQQPMPAAWGMGKYLTVGVEAKAGYNWMEVEKIEVPGMEALGLSNADTAESYFGTEEIDEEDAIELGVVA